MPFVGVGAPPGLSTALAGGTVADARRMAETSLLPFVASKCSTVFFIVEASGQSFELRCLNSREEVLAPRQKCGDFAWSRVDTFGRWISPGGVEGSTEGLDTD